MRTLQRPRAEAVRLAHRRRSAAIRALFWGAGVFALVMALIPHPLELPGHPNDKIQHMVAFATLGLLGTVAYPAMQRRWIILALSLFGAFIEIAQAIPGVHRDCDPLDWVADTIACAAVVFAVRWWRAARR